MEYENRSLSGHFVRSDVTLQDVMFEIKPNLCLVTPNLVYDGIYVF